MVVCSQSARNAGFTLMEILAALFIAMLVIGAALMSIDTLGDESNLMRPVNKLKLQARKAMRYAVTDNQSYSIYFAESYFTLGQNFTTMMEEGSRSPDEEELRPSGERYDLEEDASIEIKRWGDKEFRKPSKDGERWIFEPGGICEPLTVRINFKEAFCEITFNPLTAQPEEEYIRIP